MHARNVCSTVRNVALYENNSVLKDGFHTADTHAHTQNAEYVARRPAGNPARRHRIELDVVLKGTPF